MYRLNKQESMSAAEMNKLWGRFRRPNLYGVLLRLMLRPLNSTASDSKQC